LIQNPALSLCFVRPEYQRQGVGSLLLQWGIKKADELEADIWLTSTPQAVRTYQTNGWELREIHALDLGKYGGNGFYNRSWMVRPAKVMHEMG
jgi:GNAT superfamily N-acetyltransferase